MTQPAARAHFHKNAVAIVITLVAAVAASEARATIVTTGNLLVNSGFETGALSPWANNGTVSVSNSPVSLATGQVDATEGDYFAYYDGTFNLNSKTTFTAGGSLIQYSFDETTLAGLGIKNPTSITFGGDLFGVAQYLTGTGTATSQHRFRTTFFGPTSVVGDFFFNQERDITTSPAYTNGYRNTVSIPAGTTSFSLALILNRKGSITSPGGASIRYLLGSDDMYLSITHVVPEPSSLALAGIGALAIVIDAARRKAANSRVLSLMLRASE